MNTKVIQPKNAGMSREHSAALHALAWHRNDFSKNAQDPELVEALRVMHEDLQSIVGPRKSILHPRTFWGLKYQFRSAADVMPLFDKPFSETSVRENDHAGFVHQAQDRLQKVKKEYGIFVGVIDTDGHTAKYRILPVRANDGSVKFTLTTPYYDAGGNLSFQDANPRLLRVDQDGNIAFRNYSRAEVKDFISSKLDIHIAQQKKPGKVLLHGGLMAAASAFVTLALLDTASDGVQSILEKTAPKPPAELSPNEPS